MVRSHARRSGISSVDDLESESVSTENNNNVIWVTDSFPGGDVGERYNNAKAANPTHRKFAIPPGEYTVTTPFDLTTNIGGGANNQREYARLSLVGVTLNAETAGQPVIDMTDGRFHHIYGGVIDGQSTNTPSVGILESRDDTGKSAGSHRLFGVTVRGEYTVAPIYNYASEEVWHFGAYARNESGDAVVQTHDNNIGVTSPYRTIPSGTSYSPNGVYFEGGEFWSRGGSGSCIYIDGGDSVIVRDAFLAGDGNAHITIDSSDKSVQIPTVKGSRFHGAGGSGPTTNIEQIGSNNILGATFEANAYTTSSVALESDGTESWYDLRWLNPYYSGTSEAPNINGTVLVTAQIDTTHAAGLTDPVVDIGTLSNQASLFVFGERDVQITNENGSMFRFGYDGLGFGTGDARIIESGGELFVYDDSNNQTQIT